MIGIDTTAKMILDHYGQQKQELQAVQELSELILLLAARPDQRKDDYKQKVTQEIADSLVMIEQIRIANDITSMDVMTVVSEKLDRQLKRIKKEAET